MIAGTKTENEVERAAKKFCDLLSVCVYGFYSYVESRQRTERISQTDYSQYGGRGRL